MNNEKRLEELRLQRKLLDLEIKKLEIKARVMATVTFTVNMHNPIAPLETLHIDGKRVEKLKACLLELLEVEVKDE